MKLNGLWISLGKSLPLPLHTWWGRAFFIPPAFGPGRHPVDWLLPELTNLIYYFQTWPCSNHRNFRAELTLPLLGLVLLLFIFYFSSCHLQLVEAQPRETEKPVGLSLALTDTSQYFVKHQLFHKTRPADKVARTAKQQGSNKQSNCSHIAHTVKSVDKRTKVTKHIPS